MTLARLKVIATALPTWLAIVALAAPIAAEEIAPILPAPWADRVTAIALTVAAVATAVIQTIRRVQPVVQGTAPTPPPTERT